MAKRWRNRYRITAAPAFTGERRLACGICGYSKVFDAEDIGKTVSDHCISYETKDEAAHYSRAKYQLPFVETLGPAEGSYDPAQPAKGREGWN